VQEKKEKSYIATTFPFYYNAYQGKNEQAVRRQGAGSSKARNRQFEGKEQAVRASRGRSKQKSSVSLGYVKGKV
jgi:hypothetical protein